MTGFEFRKKGYCYQAIDNLRLIMLISMGRISFTITYMNKSPNDFHIMANIVKLYNFTRTKLILTLSRRMLMNTNQVITLLSYCVN